MLFVAVTEVGNFGRKKRLHLLSIFRYWADGTPPGDSPPVNRCGSCNVLKGRFCVELARSVCSTKLVACHSSLERMEKFKYFGTTLTNQNSIQEEIKNRLN